MEKQKYNSQTSVYLIGNVDLNYYKIGFAFDSIARMRSLCLPFDVALLASIMMRNRYEALDLEQGLHIKYQKSAIKGEWFRDLNPDDFMSDAEDLATEYLSTKPGWNY
jgi:hypothetical protein